MLLGRTLAAALIPRRSPDRSEGSRPRDRYVERASELAPESRPNPPYVTISVTARDGLKLHVRIYGSRLASARPVVCLPGFARTAADFHPLAEALAADPAEPRWVVTFDYRGHGESEYDPDPDNYSLGVDLADVSAILTALAIPPAIFVATSHGGVLAMVLARSRPAAFAGVVLNDIGPVIEPQALLQMKGYVGKLPTPRDFVEGAEILRWVFAAQFPRLAPQDWIAFARRTWRERGGSLVPDYDVGIARTLEANLEHAPPTLWDEFDALARVPLMVIRGANSNMLTPTTLDGMLARHGDVQVVVVPDQGHAPLLTEPKMMRRIATFLASCDATDPRRPVISGPADRPRVVSEPCPDRVLACSDRLEERLEA